MKGEIFDLYPLTDRLKAVLHLIKRLPIPQKYLSVWSPLRNQYPITAA